MFDDATDDVVPTELRPGTRHVLPRDYPALLRRLRREQNPSATPVERPATHSGMPERPADRELTPLAPKHARPPQAPSSPQSNGSQDGPGAATGRTSSSTVDVLIITALKSELDALLALTTGRNKPWVHVDGDPPYHLTTFVGVHGPIRVGAARLTKMGGVATARVAERLAEALRPDVLGMCGVCAGRPEDTSLGDVVIADRVFQHDHGKMRADGLKGDLWVYAMRDSLLRAAQDLSGPGVGLPGYVEADAEQGAWWVLEQLHGGHRPLKSAAVRRYLPDAQRARTLEKLCDEDGFVVLEGGELSLTPKGREAIQRRLAFHGTSPSRLPFHIHVGPMGSGNYVSGDGHIWGQLAEAGMRKIIAVEMEAASIGQVAVDRGLGFIVAKGVMDHADSHKSDRYKAFAASASAEVLLHFVRHVVRPRAAVDADTSPARPSEGLADRLASLRVELEDKRAAGESTSDIVEAMRGIQRRLRSGPTLLPGDMLSCRYLLQSVLGAGGFAQVWKALDQDVGQAVAVKVLHGQWSRDLSRIERFESGARRMATLAHEAIVPVIGEPQRDDTYHFFVMPWFAGGNLREAILKGRIDRKTGLRALARVLTGLAAAHAAGVVHRDVKPSNVLLDDEEQGWLTDFDLARAEDESLGTRTGGMGTFVYAAPEQHQKAASVDERADIYGAGMCVLFVLRGADPPAFVAGLEPAVLDEVDCGPALRNAVKGAVAYDARARTTTCERLLAALQEELRGDQTEGPDDVWEPLPGRGWLTRRSIMLGGGALGGIALASWGASALWGDDERPKEPKKKLETDEPAEDVTETSGVLNDNGEAETGASGGDEVVRITKANLELMRIPAGAFMMGSPKDDEQAYDDEHPQHRVELAEFYLARTPVTNAQYGRYLKANPGARKPRYWDDERWNQAEQPVVEVSWEEARAYCEWAGLVLPTEAQWEYACRAGKSTRYWAGDDGGDLARVGWYRENSGGWTHPVGEKEANAWGLHDVHGNVFEWCRDAFGDYDTAPQPGDGLRHKPEGDADRVVRGGSWVGPARYARSAFRAFAPPGSRYYYVGFRPALRA